VLEMDSISKMIDDIFNIENINEIQFKTIEINPNKTIYFIFHKNYKIYNGQITSGSIKPKAFILKIDEEYHYCPINKEEFDENLVKEFAEII
jgi:hypothetical protein